jgi:levanase/fructan beta-fructosidase
VIGYDAARQELFVDRSRMGSGVAPERLRQVASLSLPGGKLRVQVLFDRSSLEVFANGGEKVLTTYVYPDKGATGCAVFGRGGSAVIKNMKIWDLSEH